MYRALGTLMVSAALVAGSVVFLAAPTPAAAALTFCEDHDATDINLAVGEKFTCQTEDIHDRAAVKQYKLTKHTVVVSIIEPDGDTDAVFNVSCDDQSRFARIT